MSAVKVVANLRGDVSSIALHKTKKPQINAETFTLLSFQHLKEGSLLAYGSSLPQDAVAVKNVITCKKGLNLLDSYLTSKCIKNLSVTETSGKDKILVLQGFN